MIDEVLHRLRDLMDAEALTAVDFAAELEEKPQRINDILGSRQRLPGDLVYKVVHVFNVDANWLLTGEGDMYRRPTELMKALTSREQDLIEEYRVCDGDDQDAIYQVSHRLAEKHRKD